MARVTVEKCKGKTDSNYELVVLAAHRAKDINAGAYVSVERDNDKDPVIALREIEAGYVKIDLLRESFITSLRTSAIIDNPHESEDNLNSTLGDENDQNFDLDMDEFDINEEGAMDGFDVMFEDEEIAEDDKDI